MRFANGKFDDRQESTVNATCLEQTMSVIDPSSNKTKKYRLSIWDTAGQDVYHSLNKIYYKGAVGKYILVFIDVDIF